MKTVVYYFAKPRPFPNYSIGNLFMSVQRHLPATYQAKPVNARYHSNGLWRRFYITFEARFQQGDINHITGDIHFAALLLNRKKTVLTIHDCGFMGHSSPVARFLLRYFWLVLPIRCSKIITVVSEETKREVLRYVRCKPEKIRVVPNFISPDFVALPKAFNAQMPIILHVGTAPNKNLGRLIQALAGISCHLLILGKLSEAQKALLNRSNLSYANFYNLTTEEVRQCYQRCDLLAFVSTVEGFGLPILEAQATGRPVLTGNVSSMPEVAGDAACFVNPYSVDDIRKGVLRLINDNHYRDELIARGFENAKRYSLKTAVTAYAEIYEEVLRSS